jgi:LmbE family N-acetylglucosaminyl deacetylase
VNALVVAAHPDDEVLGCGGTIARLARQGVDVDVLILGEGITSRYDDPAQADAAEVRRLRETAESVGRQLGARGVTVAGLPDNRFDTVAMLDIVKIVERAVEAARPETVFVQHGGDLNVDHAATFRAVLTATRPMAGAPVREVLAFEVASSSEWSFQQFSPVFRGTVFYDITDTLDDKIGAMAMYEGEVRAFPHPRSPDALRAIARRWGSVVGVGAAEAFDVVRSTR